MKITYLIMCLIIAFMIFSILWKARVPGNSEHFFNLENTKALRGFWCYWVIIVHLPEIYGNRIQDLIGSFGYVGITFFFMTSGFGLALINEKRKDSIRIFWRKRLPKILITGVVANLLSILLYIVLFHYKVNWLSVLNVEEWIKWLLVCYLFFWLCCLIFKKNARLGYYVCCAAVAVSSFVIYLLEHFGIYRETIWVTECYGFAWGILLAVFYKEFVKWAERKWIKNVIVMLVLSLVLGIGYVIFKPVFIFGEYLLKILLGIAITLFMLLLNIKVSVGNKLINYLGDITLEIYVIHQTAYVLIYLIYPELSSGMFLLVSMVLSVALASVVHFISNYLANKVTGVLIKK